MWRICMISSAMREMRHHPAEGRERAKEKKGKREREREKERERENERERTREGERERERERKVSTRKKGCEIRRKIGKI